MKSTLNKVLCAFLGLTLISSPVLAYTEKVEHIDTNGASGTAPVSNGSGNLVMTDIATQAELNALVPGSSTQMIFNDGGVFGADAELTYNKTTNTLVSGVLAATTYVYAFSDDLGEYIRMDADDNYGYLNSNKDMVVSANTGGNIIMLNTLAQQDVVQTGTTPETGWIVQTATGALNTGPMSMIQQNLGKDYTASLANNGIFQDITGDHNTGVHINQAATANKSAGLVEGVHASNGVGRFIDLDGSGAYLERLYQNVTGSTPIYQWNLNENYPTTDYSGTGTLSGTTFTGDVIQLNNSQTPVFRLKYTGGAWAGENAPFFETTDTMMSSSHTITSIGTSVSDLLKLMAPNLLRISPYTNTGNAILGLGLTLYASSGGSAQLYGSNNYDGGLSLGNQQSGPISVIGAFGGADNYTTGTVDGSTGAYYSTVNTGGGSVQTTAYGGIFEADTDDSSSPGSPSGSLTNAIGGFFAVGAAGPAITNAAAGKFTEPTVYDAGNGYGLNSSITNKTAAWVNGTLSVTTSNVATSASITNMAVSTSTVRLTGSTTTSIHGIHADTFAKVLFLENTSSATVTLKNQSATDGTAANRIITTTGTDTILPPLSSATLTYDTTDSRWRVISIGSPTVDINAGTIDGTTIGSSSAADATFSAVAANLVAASSGFFTNTVFASGTATNFAVTSLLVNAGTLSSADINGGTIDGTRIGSSSAADATFSALAVSTTTTIAGSGTITSNLGTAGRNVQSRIIPFQVTTSIASATTTTGQNCAGDLAFQVPPYLDNFKVTTVTAQVSSVSTSGLLTANIRNRTDATNILSTAVTIDANERSSTTAATPPVINPANALISTNDDLCVQVSDAATGNKGLQVTLEVIP